MSKQHREAITCPSCGGSTELCYPCLLHDMGWHAMIQYAPDASQAKKMAADLDKLLGHGPLPLTSPGLPRFDRYPYHPKGLDEAQT